MRSVPSGNTFGAKVGFARAIHAPRSLLPLDLPINGQNRKVLVRPERNGYMYVLDRSTGEVLSADPYVYTTATKGFDLKSGKVIENREKAPGFGRVAREICPSAPEGKDWQPSSWSPRTRMLYVPHNNLCMDIEGLEAVTSRVPLTSAPP